MVRLHCAHVFASTHKSHIDLTTTPRHPHVGAHTPGLW
jgi:hypothetical protein